MASTSAKSNPVGTDDEYRMHPRPPGAGKARFFDSGYQNAAVFRPVFTGEFRLAVYVLAGLLVLALWRLLVAGTAAKRPAGQGKPISS